MSAPPLQPTAASIEQKNREFARELRKIENRDWWVWGYSIFVIVLLTFTVISFLLQSLGEGADTRFKIKASDAIFGLVALVIIFDVYVVYQQTLIKRLTLVAREGRIDKCFYPVFPPNADAQNILNYIRGTASLTRLKYRDDWFSISIRRPTWISAPLLKARASSGCSVTVSSNDWPR